MKHAYNLNIDSDGLREDLVFLDTAWSDFSAEYKHEMGCKVFDKNVYYVSKKVVYDLQLENIIKMFDQFNNAFMQHFKIMQMEPNELYGYHIDNNKHMIHEEIPQHMTCPAAINILLSEPVGDLTYFGIDENLNKYQSWGEKFLPINDTDEFTQTEVFETKKDAVLLNIGNWHKIQTNSNNPRKLASFLLWPYNTWQNYVYYCEKKGLLK